jgi:hypothetical protein
MPTQPIKMLAMAVLVAALSATAMAAAPSFVVKCMKTAGPIAGAAAGDKYGTYYFFLRDGIVKGYHCGLPGIPCQIVSQSPQQVVFQTPGEAPDTMVIDLRTGAIKRTSAAGDSWQYACKQIPYLP